MLSTSERCVFSMQPLLQFINNHLGLTLSWLLLLIILLVTVAKRRLSAVSMVSSREAVELINRANAVVWDMRSQQAFDKGHIAGAILVADGAIEDQQTEPLAHHKTCQVIIVAEADSRALSLASRLHKRGFLHLSVLREGITGWNNEKLPLSTVQARQQAKVEIYTRKHCPFCVRAKALLEKEKVVFEEFAIDDNEAKKQEMVKRSGRTSVPQIFINGQSIGGCDDLHALRAKDGLAPLLYR